MCDTILVISFFQVTLSYVQVAAPVCKKYKYSLICSTVYLCLCRLGTVPFVAINNCGSFKLEMIKRLYLINYLKYTKMKDRT